MTHRFQRGDRKRHAKKRPPVRGGRAPAARRARAHRRFAALRQLR